MILLPPNTISLFQSMDKGIVTVFKACYLKRALSKLVLQLKKTLMQLGRSFAWVFHDVTRKCTNSSIWKKTLNRFIHNIKGFAKGKEVEKNIHKAVVKAVNNLTWVCMRMTLRSFYRWFLRNWQTELLGLELECITEKEVREKETVEEEKEKEPPRKLIVNGLAEVLKTSMSS